MRLTALLIIVAAQSASISAQNLTVTFEPAALPGGSKIIPEWVEDGLRLTTPSGLVSNDISSERSPFNGTTCLQALFEQSPLTITSLSLQPFRVLSVDLAEYSTLFPAQKAITFFGTQVDGSILSVTFTTDGLIDGNGPGADFETFFFPATFTDLTEVAVNSDLFSMDNLVIGVVPEPSVVCLALVALVGIAAARSRLRHRL